MNLKKKIILAILACLSLTCFVACGNIGNEKTDAVQINLNKGAEFVVEENKAESGLKFSALVDKADYEKVVGDAKYSEVEFGILVAPQGTVKLYGEITADSLILEKGKYQIADVASGQWIFDGRLAQGQRVKVLSIPCAQPKSTDDGYLISGVLKGFPDKYTVESFVYKAYLRYIKDGFTNYVVSDYTDKNVTNNTVSLVELAQVAYKNADEIERARIKEQFLNIIGSNSLMIKKDYNVFTEKTVSGKEFVDQTSDNVLTAQASFAGFRRDFIVQDWTSESGKVSVDNGKITASETVKQEKITSDCFDDFTAYVSTSVAISSKEDLNYLAKAHMLNKIDELWGGDAHYALTCDLDYLGATYHERYLMPIAPIISISPHYGGNVHWGIYGELNPEERAFCGTIDGQNHQIKNAVIPYGTGIAINLKCTTSNSFIGKLGAGGVLKNIAFTDLIFEEYDLIDPYMYNVNNNELFNVTPWLESQFYDKTTGQLAVARKMGNEVGGFVGANGVDLMWWKANAGYRTGIVGIMQNATVDNVYVRAEIKNIGRNVGSSEYPSACGLIVANIMQDIEGQTPSLMKNCVAETFMSTDYYVGKMHDGAYGQSMGALVGVNYTGKRTTISNCYVITNEDSLKGIREGEIFSRVQTNKKEYMNCAIYINVADFMFYAEIETNWAWFEE